MLIDVVPRYWLLSRARRGFKSCLPALCGCLCLLLVSLGLVGLVLLNGLYVTLLHCLLRCTFLWLRLVLDLALIFIDELQSRTWLHLRFLLRRNLMGVQIAVPGEFLACSILVHSKLVHILLTCLSFCDMLVYWKLFGLLFSRKEGTIMHVRSMLNLLLLLDLLLRGSSKLCLPLLVELDSEHQPLLAAGRLEVLCHSLTLRFLLFGVLWALYLIQLGLDFLHRLLQLIVKLLMLKEILWSDALCGE
jgi:hypothetical protein